MRVLGTNPIQVVVQRSSLRRSLRLWLNGMVCGYRPPVRWLAISCYLTGGSNPRAVINA